MKRTLGLAPASGPGLAKQKMANTAAAQKTFLLKNTQKT